MNEITRPGKTKDIEDSTKVVKVGRILSPHGIKGWLKVKSDMSPPENMTKLKTILLGTNDRWEPHELASSKFQGKYFTAKFEGCNDRNIAERFSGMDIGIYRSQLPDLKTEHELYWTDLEGFLVESINGKKFGFVDHLFETGSNDVLVVLGEKECLVPFIWDKVIKDVNLEDQRIIVDWDLNF